MNISRKMSIEHALIEELVTTLLSYVPFNKLTSCERHMLFEANQLTRPERRIDYSVTKKALLILLAFVSMSAYGDTPLNPDRFVSVGLDYTAAHLPQAFPGYKLVSLDQSNHLYQKSSELDSSAMTLDLRLPMTNWLTLNAHGGSWQETVAGDHSQGYTFGGGVRVYFIGEWFNK